MTSYPPAPIPKEFNSASGLIYRELLEMAVFARRQLEDAMDCIFRRDAESARRITVQHEQLEEVEQVIEFQALEILLNFQSNEARIKMVLSAMRISRKLRRLGDHAVNIAQHSLELMELPETLDSNLLQPTYDAVSAILVEVIASLANYNQRLPLGLGAKTDQLDQLSGVCMAKFARLVETRRALGETVFHLAFVQRALESVGQLSGEISLDLMAGYSDREGAA